MARTAITSFVTLTLLLPSTLALPFEFLSFFGHRNFEKQSWHFERPHYGTSAYPTYTMTASNEAYSFPPAPTVYNPTAAGGYTQVSAPTGTGAGIATGSGTAVYPTATGYAKRNAWLPEPPPGLPTAFLSPSYPTAISPVLPTGVIAMGTGTAYSYPTSTPKSKVHLPGDGEVGYHGRFGGARKAHEQHFYPYAV